MIPWVLLFVFVVCFVFVFLCLNILSVSAPCAYPCLVADHPFASYKIRLLAARISVPWFWNVDREFQLANAIAMHMLSMASYCLCTSTTSKQCTNSSQNEHASNSFVWTPSFPQKPIEHNTYRQARNKLEPSWNTSKDHSRHKLEPSARLPLHLARIEKLARPELQANLWTW